MSLRKLERAYGVAALPATIDTHPDLTAKLPVGTNHPKTQDLCSGGDSDQQPMHSPALHSERSLVRNQPSEPVKPSETLWV